MDEAMQTATETLSSALARPQCRWGTAAIRLGNGDLATIRETGAEIRISAGDGNSRSTDRSTERRTSGALALAPLAEPPPIPAPEPLAPVGRAFVSTAFAALETAL